MDEVLAGLAHKPKAAPKPKPVKDERKHGYSETRIKHHPAGGHTVEYHPIEGGEPMSHTAENLADVHDSLEEHLHGKPSEEEMEAVAEHEGK